MRIRIPLIICCLFVCATYAQQRNYLLYTDENIDKLKHQIATNREVKQSWDEQLKKAKELLSKEKLRASDCRLLGLAYRMTGDVKYAKTTKKVILDYTSRESWERRALLGRTPPWQGGLGTSHTSFEIALGFDCIYNYLSGEERKQIAQGLVKIGINPAREDWLNPETSYHTLDTMGHNWWSACVYMAGFASLAVRNEIPEAMEWVKEINASANEWMNFSGSVLQNKPPTFDQDGGFYESLNYASYAASQYLLFLYAHTNVLPNEPQFKSPILDKVGDFFINTTYFVEEGRDLAANFGDSNIRAGGGRILNLLWNLGYQNEHYAWYIKHVSNVESRNSNSPIALALRPNLPALDSDYLPDRPKSHLYKDMGWATLRNSWDDNATMLGVKSGFTWNHAHADAGSYILFHNGKNLIIDSGNASYLSPLYTEYYCQSEAHNVIFFDGKAQNRDDPYFGVVNSGSLHNLVEGKDFKYLLANATGPYSQILARNYRSFIWVGDVILVIDDLLAHEPGQFEWLLHYNGESTLKGGIDLTITDGDAKVLVRPLYPETFPPGGERPHDFPEHMRLTEKLGYEDHHPENRQPYWSISHFEETARTKFISAIILENDKNKNNLPVIERFDGKDFLGVSVTQNGETTEVYFNLLADGRLKHRNSANNMNGWETDAYLTVLKFDENAEKTKSSNLKELFVGHGSYLRNDGQVLAHALSKYTVLIEEFGTDPKVIFQGQPNVVFRLQAPKGETKISVNGIIENGAFNASNNLLAIQLNKN